MNEHTDWIVEIRFAWCKLQFAFIDGESAEAFATTAAQTFIPQEDKFSVSIFASIAKDVALPKEEPAEC